jgi:hypothetical protein
LFSDQENAQTRGRKAWTWFRSPKVKMNLTWRMRPFPQRRAEMTLKWEISLRTQTKIEARTAAMTPASTVA